MVNLIPAKEKDSFAIFTVCNLAYLPKALVLAESVIAENNIKLNIFLFDKKVEGCSLIIDANIHWIEDLKIPNFSQLAFKYDIIELSTSLKPYLTLLLLEKYKNVIFFDPDICLYSSVEPILTNLSANSIILTPHYTTPQSNHISESDTGMLRFGSFNLGFYAVKDSEEGINFLKWWSQRCMDLCYMDSQFGLSTDQKWVSIAPCFFKDLYVSFNLGYNVAAWNSWERKLAKDADGKYWVNGNERLVFFHFSNFDLTDPGYLKKRSCYEKGLERPDFLEIGKEYMKYLALKETPLSREKYGFDYMSNGQYISPTLRRAYACILSELPNNHDPFDSEDVVGIFAKRNSLFERANMPYKREGFSEAAEKNFQLRVIYVILRTTLALVGPNKFFNLSRLMVYLSSYRLNRGLWKY